MPFKPIDESIRRVRLNTMISPECDRALRLLSEKSGLALGRIIDDLVLGISDPVENKPKSVMVSDPSFDEQIKSYSKTMTEAKARIKRLSALGSK